MYKTEGIVLRTRNLGEADRIVTVYTLAKGKVDAVAGGVRRTRSTLIGGTQLFTYGTYLIWEGRSLDRMRQAEIKESFSGLREDLSKMACSSYVAEFTDVMTMPGEPSDTLFSLLVSVFGAIEAGETYDLLLRWFEINIMHELGYDPHLNQCVACSGQSRVYRFSAKEGGVLCSDCFSQDGAAMPVSGATIAWMQRLAQSSPDQLNMFHVSERDMQELEKACRAFIDYRLPRPLKSVVFLHSLKSMA